ncbi:MAG: DUF3783 domain-containing protein [Roseburia sp.]
MEKILLFQCEQAEQMKQIAANVRVKTEVVEKEFFRETIAALATGKTKEPGEIFEGTPPEGSMMVFCNVTEKHLDRILAELKKKEISLTYKAVMTPTNKTWSVLRLYLELERERKVYL